MLQMRQLFRMADKDGDGRLTNEELKNLLNSVGITATRYRYNYCVII